VHRLKQFFRRLLFTALLGSAVVVIMALYGQLFAGQVRELEVSPDQNKIAEWRMYGKTSATTSPFSAMELRTRMNPFRHPYSLESTTALNFRSHGWTLAKNDGGGGRVPGYRPGASLTKQTGADS
jgi:hypothetical protein